MPIPKPSRRWFQFGLRTLLLLVAIACIGFGWLGYKVRQAERQRETVEAIESLGGRVFHDYELDAVGSEINSPSPPGPAWVRNLFGIDFLANVVYVDLLGDWVTDAGRVYLDGLNQLKYLD